MEKKEKTWSIPQPKGFIPLKEQPRKGTFLKYLGATLLGLGVSASLLGAGVVFYRQQVLYPSELKVDESKTGRYALSVYQSHLNSYSPEDLESITGSVYLSSEGTLQNGNESRLNFVKTILGTVKYEPLKENKLNKYGSDYYIFGSNNKTIKDISLVNYDEKVDVTFIDYTKLEFDAKTINDLMSEKGISQSDENFREKITDLFAEYISTLEDLPLKTERRSVPMSQTDKGYSVTSEEDAYLDQLLFSSQDFHDALDRFSLLTLQGTEVESKEHKEWSSKSEEERKNFTEPYKWEKYRFIQYDWVGFYSLMGTQDVTNSKDYIFPVGDGTKENPAGLNTPVTTYVFTTNSDGKEVKVPIRVTLLKVTYGSDAIKDIMKSDIRNRGIDPKSSTKYIYTEWKVENLSSTPISFEVSSGLSDAESNISARTGTMYGLKDLATLDSYQYVTLQDWYSSTELAEKYLVWGRDFAKREPLVWFKALKLSDGGIVIPDDKIQTDDISANTNNEGTEEE